MEKDDMHMEGLRLRVNQFLFNRATDNDLGWFAGAIDFDGSFMINVQWKRGGGIRQFIPFLKITNTVPPVFRKMHAMGLEAKVVPRKSVEKKDGSGPRKRCYDAILCIEDMRLVLPRILVGLAAKRPQAELMIEALGLLETKKSEDRDDAVLEIKKKIMALNNKVWPLESWPTGP